MNIALVIFRSDPARGGAERYTIDLASALAVRGHTVTLLCSDRDGTPTGATPFRSVTLRSSALTRLGQYQRFLASLDEHVGQHRYDIVHAMLPVRRCDIYHPHAGIAAASVADETNILNRLNRKRRGFARVERELLTGSNPPVVLCLSDYVKSQVRRQYALDELHLATLFNAVDLEKFDPSARPEARARIRKRYGLAQGAVIALIIAQDFHRKGLSQAIEALARVADPRLKLLVVGRDDPTRFRAQAATLEVANSVIFAGPTDDPAAHYTAADFFVLPTRHDPCSLVVLEALAMGLPVISTAQNGACELMQNGREGFILPDADDTERLADAMRSMLHDASRYGMSRNALSLRAQLSYERHIGTLLTIYERVRTG